jgi:hypothetical protein
VIRRWYGRLHIVVASPTHILVTGVGIILFEYIYGMDFSFLGFIICATVLGLGEFYLNYHLFVRIPVLSSRKEHVSDALLIGVISIAYLQKPQAVD